MIPFLLACDDPVPPPAGPAPASSPAGPAAVDVLWVVSGAPSAADARERLARDIGAFVEPLDEAGVDWQIGVLSANVDYTDPDRGALLGQPPILVPGDDVAAAFAERLGAGDGEEEGIAASVFALSPAMTAPGGRNDAFVRPDAGLLVTWVSTHDDRGDASVAESVGDLRDVKDGAVDVAAIVGLGTGCEEAEAVRYVQAIRLEGGQLHDVCEEDWTELLGLLGERATGP